MLDEIAAGNVDRATVVRLRNDLREGYEVAPEELKEPLGIMADAYDELAAGLSTNPMGNSILYGSTVLDPEVVAATEHVVRVEDEMCT